MKAKNDKEFHKLVCEREGYFCQGCGKDFSADYYFNERGINQYVCGHHSRTKKSHPELRLETDNGNCTCSDCHTKRHKGLLNYRENK